MEYTKDLILNIRYDESSNTLHLKTSKWTSKLIQKIKIIRKRGNIIINRLRRLQV